MDINEIYRLMDRFDGSTLSEMDLEMAGIKLSLKKATAGMMAGQTSILESAPVTVVPTVVPSVSAEVASERIKMVKLEAANSCAESLIKAPLVGTFYRSPAPGEAPFVTEGQKIKKGDVIGIIEAMKLMNEITAPEDGTVLEIVAEDGAMVEYDEVLVRVEPV